MKFEFNWPSSFRGEDKNVDGQRTPESLVY